MSGELEQVRPGNCPSCGGKTWPVMSRFFTHVRGEVRHCSGGDYNTPPTVTGCGRYFVGRKEVERRDPETGKAVGITRPRPAAQVRQGPQP